MNRFKELRLEKGLSQKKLAESLKISQSVICDYENEKAVPTATVTCLYADFFNVTTDFLLNREDYFESVNKEYNSYSGLDTQEEELIKHFRQLNMYQRDAISLQAKILAEDNLKVIKK